MMAEYEGDNNHDHFQRDADVRRRDPQLPPALRQEFLDFLISSVTSEFSGCVLYNEIQKNVEQPGHQEADDATWRATSRATPASSTSR